MLGSEIRFPLQSKWKEPEKRFLPLALYEDWLGFGARDLKTPLSGAGVLITIRGIARVKRECESRFPLQNNRGKLQKVLPCCFVLRAVVILAACDSRAHFCYDLAIFC